MSNQLCSATYHPAGASMPGMPSVQILCEVLALDGVNYAWVDGVYKEDPLLVPVHALNDYVRKGTLYDYLLNARHAELGDEFEQVLERCTELECSPTVLVRAIEMMHAEGMAADQALNMATQWGVALHMTDRADRLKARTAQPTKAATSAPLQETA